MFIIPDAQNHTREENPHPDAGQTPRLLKTFRKLLVFFEINPKQGESAEFREGFFLIARLLNPGMRRILTLVFTVLSRPIISRLIYRLAKRSALAGKLSTLLRIPPTLAFNQKELLEADGEIYEPIKKSLKTGDLTCNLSEKRYAWKFYFNYGTSENINETTIQHALQGPAPALICIGSGPGVASALKGALDEKAETDAWVIERGDFFSQTDYYEMTPTNSLLRSYHDGGFSPILNPPVGLTVSVAPQVWGGGADVFSGTAIKNDPGYIKRMTFSPAEYDEYLDLISRECNIGAQRAELVSEAQKRFWNGAAKEGARPFLLGKFGRDLDEGRGRDYAGFKGRIPYMDELIAQNPNIRGIANCSVKRLELEGDRVSALILEFLSRSERRVLRTIKLKLSAKTRVILGAGSPGNYKILKNSGIKRRRGQGVLHQYTGEVLGLFEDDMPANGNPQAIGINISAPGERPIVIEGAHPGRAVLAGLGAPGPVRDINGLRENLKRVGCMGVMITEEKPGRHYSPGYSLTVQQFTKNDHRRMLRGVEQALRYWKAAGAKAMGLNMPVVYPSKNTALGDMGFFEAGEIDSALEHLAKLTPQMQAFYRTGYLYGVLEQKTLAHPETENMIIVSEDSIPPGPGINPTLGLMIQARRAGRLLARKI